MLVHGSAGAAAAAFARDANAGERDALVGEWSRFAALVADLPLSGVRQAFSLLGAAWAARNGRRRPRPESRHLRLNPSQTSPISTGRAAAAPVADSVSSGLVAAWLACRAPPEASFKAHSFAK